MSALIFGVGVGLFIIISLWAVAFLLCLVSLRAHKNFAHLGIIVATFITIVLLLLPLDTPTEITDIDRIPKVYDYLFIWRILLIIFLTLSTICAGVIFVYSHLMEQKFARPVYKQRVN